MAPVRTCAGCRRSAPSDDLIRCSLQRDRVVMGSHGPGRGVWLCPRTECLERALRRGAISRGLRQPVEAAQVRDAWRAVQAFVPVDGHARG